MRAWAGLATALALLTAAGTATGCGLSANDEPQPLARDNLPSGLLDEDTTPTAVTGDLATTEVTVYFMQTDEEGGRRLVPRPRQVPAPGDAESRLQALLTQPPDEAERAQGISTAVPEDVSILSRPEHTDDGVLVVNLSESFYALQGDSSRNAFAQVVFTATEVPRVDAVRFELEGRMTEALDGDGEARRDAVDRDAYRSLTAEGEQ